MATIINADTSDGLKLTSDTSGEIQFQSGGTTKMTVGSSGVTGIPLGTKNRIINGNMAIDQRNAGASLTVTAVFPPAYSIDRFYVYGSVTSKFTAQQNAGSVTPPTGFTNYLGCTSLSAYSVGSSDNFLFGQYIEGFNVADLDFGKATAKTVTLSFWVRSSLTGTFGGSLVNSASNRSYVFSYTISSANTWEQKSITITGDITGTWLTNNGVGLALNFSIGSGSTFSTTAGSWVTGNFLNVTGATSVVGTSGATFYITGVQLETGTTATDFENLQYGQQLALCQRYYEKSYNYATALGTATLSNAIQTGGTRGGDTTLHIVDHVTYLVQKRAGATVSLWDPAGNAGKVTRDRYGEGSFPNTTPYIQGAGENRFIVYSTGDSAQSMSFHYQAVAEL
jgi:hypothetical protein